MSIRKQIFFGLMGIVIVALLAYFGAGALGLDDFEAGNDAALEEGDLADMTPGQRLCASQVTVDAIRARVFERAREATDGDPALLTRLETGTIARMQDAQLVRFDDGLDQARCDGRLVLELPRGSEPAFSNSRRLMVSMSYLAQPASGSSGSAVARLEGVDDLIRTLASADLVTHPHSEIEPKPEDGFDDFGKDEFEPEFDEPVPGDPGFEEANPPPPENLLPDAMQEDDPGPDRSPKR